MERAERLWPDGPRYRYDEQCFPPSTDSFLLGGFASLRRGEKVCDLGAGAGLLGLLLLAREPSLQVTGIERDAHACDMLAQNAAENRLPLTALCADLRQRETLPAGAFQLAVSNPPYFAPHTGAVAKGVRGDTRAELTATLEDGTVLASGVELASGASFEQTVEWTPTQSGTLTATVSGTSDNGEAISVLSDELAITTQDASQALVLDVTAQAQTNTIYSEPAVVRFAVQVKNIGQTDAATLTVKEAGTTVATIPSLPSGESRTLVFDLETSIAGQIQFEVSGKDAAGNDKAYDSNVIQLTYIEPTPEPTATPAPTAVPPTPTPEPTATPVPTIGEIIAQHVNPVVLYTIAGVLAALIVALVAVSSVSGAKRKKRMEQAIDTIELSPDVRDSFGKRRRRAQNAGDVKPEKKREKTPEEKTAEAQIVPTPEFKPDEFIASGKNEQKSEQKQEGEETHRRRAPQDVPTDKTLRVAPVEERPEFVPQGKVDDSKTRIFGKLDVENAVNEEQKKAEEAPKAEQKSEAGQETIRLTGEEVQKLKAQVREDHFGMKGKKRDEIKPMKKKKGLFGLGHKKDDDDLLIDDEVDEDDDDDLFE